MDRQPVAQNPRGRRPQLRQILDKLTLGSDTMLDLGNLYTAALPAWIAAGFEQALEEESLKAGDEVPTLGYGSGDAAEVIPFTMANADHRYFSDLGIEYYRYVDRAS